MPVKHFVLLRRYRQEHIIEQRAYHDKSGDITWADCELRKYLNGVLYETFSKIDQEKIASATN